MDGCGRPCTTLREARPTARSERHPCQTHAASRCSAMLAGLLLQQLENNALRRGVDGSGSWRGRQHCTQAARPSCCCASGCSSCCYCPIACALTPAQQRRHETQRRHEVAWKGVGMTTSGRKPHLERTSSAFSESSLRCSAVHIRPTLAFARVGALLQRLHGLGDPPIDVGLPSTGRQQLLSCVHY